MVFRWCQALSESQQLSAAWTAATTPPQPADGDARNCMVPDPAVAAAAAGKIGGAPVLVAAAGQVTESVAATLATVAAERAAESAAM